jgi:hypothetical protein
MFYLYSDFGHLQFANTTLIGLALQRTTFAYYYVAQLHNLKVMMYYLSHICYIFYPI